MEIIRDRDSGRIVSTKALPVTQCCAPGCTSLATGEGSSKSMSLCPTHHLKYKKDNGIGVYGRFEITCKKCGEKFRTRDKDKMYCNLKCYTSSDQFKAMQLENGKKYAESRTGRPMGQLVEWTCLQCAVTKEVSARYSQRKFCGKSCYRAYMADRFDRFIANPESVSLPQCYDEFLDREELPCLIEGCDWVGKFLSTHVNYSHGITAEKFKEMAGFNRKTGLVSKDVSTAMSERMKVRAANGIDGASSFATNGIRHITKPGQIRLEGREHIAKSFSLGTKDKLRAGLEAYKKNNPGWKDEIGQKRKKEIADRSGAFARVECKCTICGSGFQGTIAQSRSDVAICSNVCKSRWYREQWTEKRDWQLSCFYCKKDFMGSYTQNKSCQNGKNVFCSKECQFASRKPVTDRKKVKKWPLTCAKCQCQFLGNSSQKANVKRGKRLRCDDCKKLPKSPPEYPPPLHPLAEPSTLPQPH